eukprot:Ihof_evm5s260 gene=Ihof_evmTU5s260
MATNQPITPGEVSRGWRRDRLQTCMEAYSDAVINLNSEKMLKRCYSIETPEEKSDQLIAQALIIRNKYRDIAKDRMHQLANDEQMVSRLRELEEEEIKLMVQSIEKSEPECTNDETPIQMLSTSQLMRQGRARAQITLIKGLRERLAKIKADNDLLIQRLNDQQDELKNADMIAREKIQYFYKVQTLSSEIPVKTIR